MKKTFTGMPLYLLCVLFLLPSCGFIKEYGNTNPVRWGEKGVFEGKGVSYRDDELLIFYKQPPTPESKKQIEQDIISNGVTVTEVRKCNDCDGYVELWKGSNIHTIVHGDGVKAGSGRGGSKGVGEDSLARYSLNYINRLPVDITDGMPNPNNSKPASKTAVSGAGKDTILIAVLDTGIDTLAWIGSNQLWVNPGEKKGGNDKDHNCYIDDINGWNFLSNTPNFHDDNMHGTLVSRYIMDEFTAASPHFVQLMGLKTHDHTGSGDLFSTICAIHYAVKKGAKIINASWGFYYYEDNPHPYLDSLITNICRSKGILFLAAAGNKIPQEDLLAKSIYQQRYGTTPSDAALRNLALHNFYPANFSKADNNVITVTTTDGSQVSATQNWNATYASLAIKADVVTSTHMKFLMPFASTTFEISGSSFATAIATGKIGAWLPLSAYAPGIDKETVFKKLTDGISDGSIPNFMQTSIQLRTMGRIQAGRYTKRR
ncbi:MAG: S8 family serine peptidase [Candidatus Pseudobacter hemicellulosilyticus]|uniref:S8 family serine peptidase n=1 Tax=Candidatus Pseudobacter hemicellulosilyticus TaxID=3121375 RepID=A0AAJ5WQW5_9BACT|nr:MAG: S8 family serine peptidase [Pseudobacter sp.]